PPPRLPAPCAPASPLPHPLPPRPAPPGARGCSAAARGGGGGVGGGPPTPPPTIERRPRRRNPVLGGGSEGGRSPPPSLSMRKEIIQVDLAASNPNLSAATRFGNLVFAAGQTGRHPDTGELGKDIREQTRHVLERIARVLAA